MLNHLLFPCLEVIKLKYSLRLKIKRNNRLLANIALYFESENELKFYNLEAWYLEEGFSQIFTIKDVNLSHRER